MTSEVDSLKTNEFLRRRKLRLQQVREQSKDIAKKIRQRAKVEKLQQVVELDAKKQKEYLQRQEKLVKRLEEFYAKGIENVGISHKSASEIRSQGDQGDKEDISKKRGKEAAAELRKKRQQKLDEQKKLLDRKLQAREAANEISREKSVVVTNKLQSKSDKGAGDIQSKSSAPEFTSNKDTNTGHDNYNDKNVTRNDMASQWDVEEMPNEWEPNIPTLSLPKDDKDSVKETNNNNVDKNKRLDLFALSEEMPSSLRGGLTQTERVPIKPSLTLVSEYLQNRGLRLRETDSVSSKKMDDLQSLRQTILRTRTSKEVSAKSSTDKASKTSAQSSAVQRKSSVTLYNHFTKDSREVPYHDEKLVVRDSQADEDAYSQAMKESVTDNLAKGHNKKIQEIRSKVAMTKQNVEKEYRDTISFLNALPKDKGNKPIRTAFMDEQRQQMQKDNRQQKLQQEYKKIEKECRKHSCKNKPLSKPRSPPKEHNDVFESTDFQYSWMPVPESDGNLAIHTIPTALKEGKSGNTVKFSKVDSYHEYRSRHKHTPPTKDTTQEKPKRQVEAVVIQNTSDSESVSSDTSSVDNISLETKDKHLKETEKISDAERIIIYKILDSKINKKGKTSKLIKDMAKSLTVLEKQKSNKHVDKDDQSKKSNSKIDSNVENRISFEQLNEGVYKTVNENGDNIASMYFQDTEGERYEITADELMYGRSCSCNKNISKDQQQDIGTSSRPWESGDKRPATREPNLSSGCECGCKSVKPKEKIDLNQPSAATSTSSFKTATNDKANNALPDGGYIKLIDNGGQEAGKFYIGASGFLRDDAYEVVIQLRKKEESGKIENKESAISAKSEDNSKKDELEHLSMVKESVEIIDGTTTQNSTTEVQEPNQNDIESAADTQTASTKTQSVAMNRGHDAVANVVSEIITDPVWSQTVCSSNIFKDVVTKPTNELNNVCEKGVSTSFQDSYAIPSHISKSDFNPRPATSTYTQTSINSPNHRPVFFHMSSSTSTAYMSPPEMIIPNFLKQDYRLTNEEMYDPRNYEMQEKIEVTEQQEYSQESDCRCKKCMRARKIILSKVHTPLHRCKKSRNENGTPPNTARNYHTEDEGNDYIEKNTDYATDYSTKRNCKCRKCDSRNCFRDGDNLLRNKKSQHLSAAKHSRNLIMRVTSSATSSNKDSRQTYKKSKSVLKPIIKDYVDKLLVLNRTSLKAVQVMDQECSSITTPGSSIVEVPGNINHSKPALENKISLEQIRQLLQQNDDKETKCQKRKTNQSTQNTECLKKQYNNNIKLQKMPRKNTAHKVKSLNISKNLFRTKKAGDTKQPEVNPVSSSTKGGNAKEQVSSIPSRSKIRSKSSPTPRLAPNDDITYKTANSDIVNMGTKRKNLSTKYKSANSKERKSEKQHICKSLPLPLHRATLTSSSTDSDNNVPTLKQNNDEFPTSISTQTSLNVDSEINFMKLAEDKLQNMEKIADLTEKCTQRLSNLAKVLEEVRKNKSLAYSQISTSDTTSDSDQKSDKNMNKISAPNHESLSDGHKSFESQTPAPVSINKFKEQDILESTDYVPLLSDIPKPVAFKNLNSELTMNSSSSSSKKSSSPSPIPESLDHATKNRGKPPPALSRIHLKHGQDFVVPHELSTVVEVDSPMSVKLKSSRNDTRPELQDTSNKKNFGIKENLEDNATMSGELKDTNPYLLESKVDITNMHIKISTTESSDDSKIQMIDMKQFNEIMLKPFFSIQEYAKQCSLGVLDDGSNLDDIVRDDPINDELSSLHSDGSLPDVISELLKRNIITEPFKFDTASNANSTTVSSESTMSVLALSKARQGKKKSSIMFQNKENMAETSDTLSISSNPDLENAFKKLGMGWASSTLKKTKERLALSSSSNTSSSSLSQFKIKSFSQDIPALVTDTVSSVLNLSKKPLQGRNATDSSKNAEQQTSLSNSMTVKEFLTNELAAKITFTNKSKNDTEEFVSLFETKMPEEMKHSSRMVHDDHSIDNSMRSGNNNRARTSTPVQLFKSMTYRSSSSSNLSNGLFSNADDLSSVKVTSNSMKHSTSDKDDLIIPNFSLRMKRGSSECSKSD